MQGMCSTLWVLFDGKWRVGEKERVSDLLAMVLTTAWRRLDELLVEARLVEGKSLLQQLSSATIVPVPTGHLGTFRKYGSYKSKMMY